MVICMLGAKGVVVATCREREGGGAVLGTCMHLGRGQPAAIGSERRHHATERMRPLNQFHSGHVIHPRIQPHLTPVGKRRMRGGWRRRDEHLHASDPSGGPTPLRTEWGRWPASPVHAGPASRRTRSWLSPSACPRRCIVPRVVRALWPVKGRELHPIERRAAAPDEGCNQHAISMQSARNQHAISMQSACNQSTAHGPSWVHRSDGRQGRLG